MKMISKPQELNMVSGGGLFGGIQNKIFFIASPYLSS